jgi:hypothetical protein
MLTRRARNIQHMSASLTCVMPLSAKKSKTTVARARSIHMRKYAKAQRVCRYADMQIYISASV